MNLKDSLSAIVRTLMRDVTYHKNYICTVTGGDENGGTLDLKPDDGSIAGEGLQGIPIAYALPGAKITAAPGAKALLWYDSGDPRQPRCQFIGGTPLSISFFDGQAGLARIGDTVLIDGVAPIPSTGGPVTGTGTIIAGSPKVKA